MKIESTPPLPPRRPSQARARNVRRHSKSSTHGPEIQPSQATPPEQDLDEDAIEADEGGLDRDAAMELARWVSGSLAGLNSPIRRYHDPRTLRLM